MKYLFRGGTVVSGRGTRRADVLVEDEKILRVARSITAPEAAVIDVEGQLLLPGLIDAHYRGELKVILINLDPSINIQINKGDRIAQLVIQEVPTVNLIEVEELDKTDRGAGGFGSSGVL